MNSIAIYAQLFGIFSFCFSIKVQSVNQILFLFG